MFDPSTASPTGTVLFHNGMPYTYQNGMAVFPPQEYAGYPTQPQYPVMYSQPVIMPQQNFQYQPVGDAAALAAIAGLCVIDAVLLCWGLGKSLQHDGGGGLSLRAAAGRFARRV